jgi:type III restriction enzyme
MKIQFNSNLDYQKEAVDAIVDIFKGQEKCASNFTVYSATYIGKNYDLELNGIKNRDIIGYGNQFTLTDGKLLENVQSIQLGNGLKPSSRNDIDRSKLDFTIEMETGTGKTYVYLKTIIEMYKKYGFSKHIIVVPSIPIKEGVYKSLQITQEHFKELNDNLNYNFFIYDSSKLNEVRDFSSSDGLEIMVINIDAFAKSFENPEDEKKTANIIHRYKDTLGYIPLELIRNTKPIVIIDEPQSTMSTPIRKMAVQNLNPLAIFRYSATHKANEKINMMYKLDAIDAYEKKLVKQIEVATVATESVRNQAYIYLKSISISKGMPVVELEMDVFKDGEVKRKTVRNIKKNDDLEDITEREEYSGFIVKDIHAVPGSEYINFTSNDSFIRLGESIGNTDDTIIKYALISKTIEEHLDKELILNAQGIKVLTLFFIDTVSKYRQYDDEGNEIKGEYAAVFEKEYKRIIAIPKYKTLFDQIKDIDEEARAVHNGYFSIDKKSKSSNSKEKFEYFKDTSGSTIADEDTYNLIMRDKEMLLSFDSKLRFIFSHSALKEGWDNPNVFQICTLKEAGNSEIKRRQEIGRGLRLCVNQSGERVYGHEVNTLTVMASESYMDFVANLQKEMEAETGIKFGIIESHSFSDIVLEILDEDIVYLGQEQSTILFQHLKTTGYIDNRGKVQDSLRIALRANEVILPEEFKSDAKVHNQIINTLKQTAGKLEVRDSSNKKKVAVNKRVLDSPEFKALWDKVKYKTTFSVNFDSAKLIKDCIKALNDRLIVKKGRLTYQKVSLTINIGGIDAKEDAVQYGNIESEVDQLPDIVSYLQNETQLTRKSIVEILTSTPKLSLFKRNPQKFIEGCIDIINEQMSLQIVDGIKYKRIGDAEYYSQELFKNEELFGYMKENLKESTKSPFDHIVYDSIIESNLASEFELNKNISVYAKLPSWFKIDTPLGTYNPDWAVLWKDENEEKLFFVVESKGSVSSNDLRPKEKAKIDCGMEHFKSLGSEMIVAKSIEDLVTHILGNV